MKIPKQIDINFNVKFFLKQKKINEIEFKIDKKVFKQIAKLCSKLERLGYEFDLKFDDKKYCYRDGEIFESEE